MFGSKYNEKKLKSNLVLVSSRLKLLAKKKTEQSIRNRSEIVEYVRKHKLDSARVRVELAIRDDYLIEAFELVELHASLLDGRLGLLRQSKRIEDEIKTQVSTLIWSSSRLHEHCQELKVVCDQLRAYYGKKFVEACRKNEFGAVCNRLMKCLDVTPPKKSLVEHYLANMCRSAGIDYHFDEQFLLETEENEEKSAGVYNNCCGHEKHCIEACSSIYKKDHKNLPQSFSTSLPSYSETNQTFSKDSKCLEKKMIQLFSIWQNEEVEQNPGCSDQTPPTYAECISSSKNNTAPQLDSSKSFTTKQFPVCTDRIHPRNLEELNSTENDLDELTNRLEKLKNMD